MTQPSDVELAREAFSRGDWRAAHDRYARVLPNGGLVAADLQRLSRTSWLLGDGPASMAQSELLYKRLVPDRPEDAAGLALRLAVEWFTCGNPAVATAWLGRSHRLLERLPPCPTTGYLRYLEGAFGLDMEESAEPAEVAAAEIEALDAHFDDPALGCFALVLRGLAAVQRGRTAAGFDLLDEAMLPVVAGRIDALWAGDIYCSVIHLCEGLADLSRMREWTDALDRWAKPISDAFVYAGVTRVHQLQLISAEGGWDVVERELGTRSDDLVGSHGWLAGIGHAELGDVRRLRGDLDGAARSYAAARALAIDPQPGAALLLRASGDLPGALLSLRESLGAAGRLQRARMLLTGVTLAVEAGDVATAQSWATELAETARLFDTAGLRARADRATAEVLLARERPAEALAPLERAARVYREQRFRLAIAGVHDRLAVAYGQLGDTERAASEVATALAVYRRLGARPDIDRLTPGASPGGLTAREVEVLALVAAGASNREVATRLVISDKTVGRHLANIFAKIGVSSRTAAAAWSHAHGIQAASRP